MFYASDSCSVGKELPLAATGLLDMITIVLAGKGKPTGSQLKRLLGARKHMVRDLVEYMQDRDANLVSGFTLGREASMSEANLDTYPCDGGVPPELLKACLNLRDQNNLRRKAASSYTNDRREDEEIDDDDDDDDDNSGAVHDAGEDAKAYIIDAYAVMDSAEDTVTSSLQRPNALRNLGDDLDMNSVAAAETVLRMGKAVPGGTENVLVVPHGNVLSDFHNNDAWVAGFVHLFPEGCGGARRPFKTAAYFVQKVGEDYVEPT